MTVAQASGTAKPPTPGLPEALGNREVTSVALSSQCAAMEPSAQCTGQVGAANATMANTDVISRHSRVVEIPDSVEHR
jgi:hypothetical protein